MPIAVAGGVPGQRRTFRLPGMPDFNVSSDYTISEFTGLRGRAAPDATLVANGGGAGAVAVGSWLGKERLHTISGRIQCSDRAEMFTVERALVSAIPPEVAVPVQVIDPNADDLQLWVRLYDEPVVTFAGLLIRFSIPVVCPEGVKYALEPLTGDVGVFTGQSWHRTYTASGRRTYALPGGRWVRTYERSVPSGPYPMSLTLTSPGDATSRRVTVAVTGPLASGDWWLWNEATGERIWVDVPVLADQELVLDMAARTARLNGAPVDHLVQGDWLSLIPGANVFRLVSGSASSAFANVTALPAYL